MPKQNYFTSLTMTCLCLSACALGLRFGSDDENPRAAMPQKAMPHAQGIQLEGLSGLSTRDAYAEQNERFSAFLRKTPSALEFVQLRGPPTAYAQQQHGIWRREVMYLFYPYEREYFIAEGSGGKARVRGPVRIPDSMLSAIRVATRQESGDVKLSVLEEVTNVHNGPGEEINSGNNTTFQKNFPVQEKEILYESQAPDPRLIELNARLKGLVQRLAGGPDLLFDGGDLVHIVKFTQETPAVLAAWYSVRVDHEGRLARILGLKPQDPLPIGMRVRIPMYLVENQKELSEEASQAIFALLASFTPYAR